MTLLRMPRPFHGVFFAFAIAGVAIAGVPPTPRKDLKPVDPCKDVAAKAAKGKGKTAKRATAPKVARKAPAGDPIVLAVTNDAIVPGTAIAILEVRGKKDPCS